MLFFGRNLAAMLKIPTSCGDFWYMYILQDRESYLELKLAEIRHTFLNYDFDLPIALYTRVVAAILNISNCPRVPEWHPSDSKNIGSELTFCEKNS